jgi:F-type H+-transporting ATPase subunit gamma
MMSRRREIARRLEALSDIAGIMSAMKGLALMEVRILTDFLASQHRMVAGIEATASDFLAAHGEFASRHGAGQELCIVVGSEQGFCGDFNESLLARQQALCEQKDGPLRWLVVGRRLASRIGDRDCVELALPGAIVVDEVPAILLRLSKELGRLLTHPTPAGFGLSALYHCAATGEIRLRRLLPLRDLPAPERSHAYPAELNLRPEDFLRALTGLYLLAVLNEVLYSSLMAENRQRQVHMDSALQRLDEDRIRLKLRYNIQRQEEITEEIEVILLSTDMLHEAEHGS